MVAFACAALVGVIGFLRREKSAENWRKRFIRKAKRRGASAEAFTIKKEERADGGTSVTYEYEVGRNKYRKTVAYAPETDYSNRIIVYYDPKAPGQGVCEESKEVRGVGLNIAAKSFVTFFVVLLGTEIAFGGNELLGGDADQAADAWKRLFSNPQALVVAAVAIALYALEFRWIAKRGDAWEKKKEAAIEEKRTALGTRISSWYERGEKYSDRVYHATYVYEVDGRKYKKSVHAGSRELPHMLWFYYTGDPGKAFCDYDKSNDNVVRLLAPVLFILPIAVTYLLAKLLGFDLEALANL